ncbi:MAG: metalloregulator ArsR/SmtB family transcription factor [Fimbriimonadales bacterium]
MRKEIRPKHREIEAETLVGSLRDIVPDAGIFDGVRHRAFLNFGVELLGSLAHPTRIRIVSLLRSQALTVGQIQSELEIAQANASQHLQVLVRSGVLTREALGASRVYRLRDPSLCDLLDKIEQFWQSHKEDIVAERLG